MDNLEFSDLVMSLKEHFELPVGTDYEGYNLPGFMFKIERASTK